MIEKESPFENRVLGRFVTDEERSCTCKRCGRIFSDPASAFRPHLSEDGADCRSPSFEKDSP